MSIHPLFIDHVLDVIMQQLSLRDIRSCDLVCKKWCYFANKELQKRTEPMGFELFSRDNIKKAIKLIITSERGGRYSRLCIGFLPLFCLNVQKLFHLTNRYVTTLSLYAIQTTKKELLTLLCSLPELSDLDIQGLTLHKKTDPKYSLFPFYKENTNNSEIIIFPMIRRLQFPCQSKRKFHVPPLKQNFYVATTTTFLSDALRTFPNVQELTVVDLIHEDINKFQFKSMLTFDPMGELFKYSRNINIDLKRISVGFKKFSLTFTSNFQGLTDHVLNMLLKLHVKAEHLEIKYHPAREQISYLNMPPEQPLPPTSSQADPLKVNVELLKQFICNLSPKLKALEICQVDAIGRTTPTVPSFCPFPIHLLNLRFLEIHRAFVKNYALVMNELPLLEEARFRFASDTNWSRILPAKLKEHPNLKTLRIEHIDGKSLLRLLKSFPKLKTLHIIECTEEIISTLGDVFPELKDENIIKGYGSVCLYCEEPNNPSNEKLPFSIGNGIKVNVFTKSIVFPELRSMFLRPVRNCQHNYRAWFLRGTNGVPDDNKADQHENQPMWESLPIFERPEGALFLYQLWSVEPYLGLDASTFHILGNLTKQSEFSY